MTTHRPYGDISDIVEMTRVLEAGLAASLDSGYMHPGDLQWRAFGPHGFPLSEIIEVWEDGGAVVGFVMLESASGFSAQVTPELRGGHVEREVLGWGLAATLRWRAEHGLEPLCTFEVFADDAQRIGLLEALGFRATETGWIAFRSELDEIECVTLPAGFEARAMRDDEIESRATCQREAFSPGSSTTSETWQALRSDAPGYDADLDSVVVGPDGVVVAAAMSWVDVANGIGLFEPVGTRPAFQGKGFGRALMLRGLRALREHGMRTAFVSTNRTNERGIALYRSVGFEDRNLGFEYEWRSVETPPTVFAEQV